VPKKFDSSSRGFAFLEFVSRKEAENAFDALKHTHLLGRHVVLEWAEDAGAGGDLENLRERVKAAYGDGKEERPGRKRKLNMDSTLEVEEEGEDFIAV
jgi:multiple RNA-binding domain-containing protein 1